MEKKRKRGQQGEGSQKKQKKTSTSGPPPPQPGERSQKKQKKQKKSSTAGPPPPPPPPPPQPQPGEGSQKKQKKQKKSSTAGPPPPPPPPPPQPQPGEVSQKKQKKQKKSSTAGPPPSPPPPQPQPQPQPQPGEGSQKKQKKQKKSSTAGPTTPPPPPPQPGEGSQKKQKKQKKSSTAGPPPPPLSPPQPGEGSPKKQKKSSTAGATTPPPSPPSPPLRMIAYNTMPMNHKKKWFINDDVGGSVRKYTEIISWLRVMACLDGSVFEDIPNLNWGGEEGYPLLEVEVVSPQKKPVKFVIVKSSLYLIACDIDGVRFQFKCEFRIDSFTMLNHKGTYTTKPWNNVGPKCIISEIDTLNGIDKDICMHDAAKMSSYIAACEVFYVHLCEAARLYVVESIICRTLEPLPVQDFEDRTYVQEEGVLLRGTNGKIVDNNQDVYSLVKGNGPINFNLSFDTPDYIDKVIHSYKQMSKVWYMYSLSGRRHFEMNPKLVSELHMRSIKSLRCSLGVLCNTNLNKLVIEWEKKSKKHPVITLDVYEEMKKQVCDLQEHKKVLV